MDIENSSQSLDLYSKMSYEVIAFGKESSNSFFFGNLEKNSVEMASIINKIIKFYEQYNSKIKFYPYQLNYCRKEELDRFLFVLIKTILDEVNEEEEE
jgi:hypothetical protein